MTRKAHSSRCGQYFSFGLERVTDRSEANLNKPLEDSGLISFSRIHKRGFSGKQTIGMIVYLQVQIFYRQKSFYFY